MFAFCLPSNPTADSRMVFILLFHTSLTFYFPKFPPNSPFFSSQPTNPPTHFLAGKTRDQEQQRVDKELANVRLAFTSGRMSPYDKKKYVWKLVYINMMGYDVDFGHMEMISLVSAPSYAEKLVGYMSTAVMLRNTDPQITLVVQAIKQDLESTQDPIQCLALCAIANIGGKELAEAVARDVERILFSRSIFPVVRKKAALCLLRLARINRDLLPAGEFGKKLTTLLEDKNLGVILSVITLIHGLAEKDPAAYENCTGHLLVWLTRLAVQKTVPEDYGYHSVACPWIQVKILRTLQCFPIPATEGMRTRLNEILTHIMNKTEVTKSVNRNNAEHCILFEAINLIMKQGDLSLPDLRAKSVAHLSKFINIREPNIRYLGLEMMSKMTTMEGTGDAIRKQQHTVFFSLKDADISIRRRALDLLFNMCNKEVAASIVKELLATLAVSDWQIKDEMVLKVAILAERFAPDLRWYVDTIVSLISLAGDHVADDVWHRLVQIVTNTDSLQKYAASKAYHSLEPVTAHETAVKVGGYILGEFGYMLNDGDEDGGPAISGAQQFAAVHQHFTKCATSTKCILLSTYCKMQNLYPELRPAILPIFEAHTTVIDAELQQRAIEYLHVPELSEEVTSVVLEVMPHFPERENVLEVKLKKQSVSSRCASRTW
jgi:AP-2 complex subunit alpha